jgi:hypothetical protein
MNIYGRVGWRAAAAVNPFVTDADALAFVTAASITDSTQQTAINTLVTQLKTYGIWTKLKAVYPFVGGTATSHQFNLKDPRDLDAAFRLTFVGGGTHSSTGYQGNGSNGYANTFLSPSTTLTTNNIHYSYYNRTNISELRYDIGSQQSSPTRAVVGALNYLSSGSNRFFFAINSNEKDIINSDPRKFFIANKTTASSLSGFINTTKTTYAVTDSTLPTIPMFINARNLNGTNGTPSSKECAFASIGNGLTDTEAANFYTAVQAYQTTLGRAV